MFIRVDGRLCWPADAAVAVGEGVLAAGQVVVAVGGVQEVGPVAALGVVTAALLALRRAAGHDVPHLCSKCQSYDALDMVPVSVYRRIREFRRPIRHGTTTEGTL